jgi:phosphatidylglycerol---prolipoprotein diacylglyceryl transferase
LGILGTLGVFRKLFPKQKPVILFDFDGTVMDTEPAVIATYEKLYENHKLSHIMTPEFKKTLMGPPLKRNLCLAF